MQNRSGSKRTVAVAVVVLILFASSGAESAYFDSYIDMTSTVRGRNMTDPTGDFTLNMKNTYKECWCQEWVKATLKKDLFGPDPSYGTVYYENDGVWRTADWNTSQDNNKMFFHYQQSPGWFGFRVRNDVEVR